MEHWPLFNFKKHWDTFYGCWYKPEVQSVLDKRMHRWCATHNIQKRWFAGDSLWWYSTESWWEDYVDGLVDEYLASHPRILASFEETCDTDDDEEISIRWEYSKEYNDIVRMFQPKKGSLESLIMVGEGADKCIFPALYKTARLMFPSEPLRHDARRSVVYLLNQQLRFDLIEYFIITL